MVTEREAARMEAGMAAELDRGRTRWLRGDVMVCVAWGLVMLGAALGGALNALPA